MQPSQGIPKLREGPSGLPPRQPVRQILPVADVSLDYRLIDQHTVHHKWEK